MAIGSGLSSQFGFVAASAAHGGDRDTLLEIRRGERQRLSASGSRAARVWSRGQAARTYSKGAGGDIELEVMNKGFGLLFKHMLRTAEPRRWGGDQGSICTQSPRTSARARPASWRRCRWVARPVDARRAAVHLRRAAESSS